MYMSLWLHDFGARIVALPLRLVIGLIFINQGLQNIRDTPLESQTWIRLSDFPFLEDAGGETIALGAVLCVAGAMAMLGVFTRVVGAAMCFVVLTNMFAGLSGDNLAHVAANMAKIAGGEASEFDAALMLLQQRVLLAVCSLVLVFLGSGIFALDSIIFRTLSGAFKEKDDKRKKELKDIKGRKHAMDPGD